MANNPDQSDSSSSSGSSSSDSSSSSSSYSSSSSDEEEENIPEETKLQLCRAKSDYRQLKFKLLQSIKENEILVDELRKHQRKLLRLNRDKYFLFERLLAYEKPPPKQNAPKEEKIEIVDGVPTVVRVGKKRGPKPKRRKSDSPPPPTASLLAAALEPGSSLLRLKSNSIGPVPTPGRKRGPKKKEEKLLTAQDHMTPSASTSSTITSSNNAVTFSPGFSKSKLVPSLKRQHQAKSNIKSNNSKQPGPKKAASFVCQPIPQSELSNSTTEDTVMSYRSDSGPPEFFRQDSFSQEMPDNLFDD